MAEGPEESTAEVVGPGPAPAAPGRPSRTGKLGFWLSLLPATAIVIGTAASPG